MKTYRDTMTAIEKQDLADYLASLEAEQKYLRENPYRPYFGQWPHTLELREPQPDPHYFQGAGQEPPTESQDDDDITIRGVVYLTLFLAFLAVVVMLLAPCIWSC